MLPYPKAAAFVWVQIQVRMLRKLRQGRSQMLLAYQLVESTGCSYTW